MSCRGLYKGWTFRFPGIGQLSLAMLWYVAKFFLGTIYCFCIQIPPSTRPFAESKKYDSRCSKITSYSMHEYMSANAPISYPKTCWIWIGRLQALWLLWKDRKISLTKSLKEEGGHRKRWHLNLNGWMAQSCEAPKTYPFFEVWKQERPSGHGVSQILFSKSHAEDEEKPQGLDHRWLVCWSIGCGVHRTGWIPTCWSETGKSSRFLVVCIPPRTPLWPS